MKIIIAPDSFKGSLSAVEVAKAIKKGIKNAFPEAKTLSIPMADGGEGTTETLVTSSGGKLKYISVKGPLGNKVKAMYGVLGDNKTCVIEVASASGLDQVPEGKNSPLDATTYGTGQLIKQALDDGYESFILGLGGSATNDGGAGMLQALGMEILNKDNEKIGFGGGKLKEAETINLDNFDQRIKYCKFIIASDVENTFIGRNGASYTFGPQKGASEKDVKFLDECLENWADIIEKTTGYSLHQRPGAGAAGGIGGAFLAFFPSEISRGVDVMLEYSNFDSYLEDTDLVITGEGKVDNQTLSGKTPLGVSQAANKKRVPTIIISGSVGEGTEELHENGVISIHSIINSPCTIDYALQNASKLLQFTSEQVTRCYFSNKSF